MCDRGLLVAGHRVVDGGRDTAFVEELRECVAIGCTDDVEVVHVAGAERLDGKREGKAREASPISLGQRPPLVVHDVKPTQ